MATTVGEGRSANAALLLSSLRGHVPVRVLGFRERSVWALPRPDPDGRLEVVLVRVGGVVAVRTADGVSVGQLPVRWTGLVERELRRCEALGELALARATLTGRKDERDLCVFLPWPGTRWRED